MNDPDITLEEEFIWMSYNFSLASFCNSINLGEDLMQSYIDLLLEDEEQSIISDSSNKISISNSPVSLKNLPGSTIHTQCIIENNKNQFFDSKFKEAENKENDISLSNQISFRHSAPYINNLFDERSLSLLSQYLND